MKKRVKGNLVTYELEVNGQKVEIFTDDENPSRKVTKGDRKEVMQLLKNFESNENYRNQNFIYRKQQLIFK